MQEIQYTALNTFHSTQWDGAKKVVFVQTLQCTQACSLPDQMDKLAEPVPVEVRLFGSLPGFTIVHCRGIHSVW